MEPSAVAVGVISDRRCHAVEKAAGITEKDDVGHKDVLELFLSEQGFNGPRKQSKNVLKICSNVYL